MFTVALRQGVVTNCQPQKISNQPGPISSQLCHYQGCSKHRVMYAACHHAHGGEAPQQSEALSGPADFVAAVDLPLRAHSMQYSLLSVCAVPKLLPCCCCRAWCRMSASRVACRLGGYCQQPQRLSTSCQMAVHVLYSTYCCPAAKQSAQQLLMIAARQTAAVVAAPLRVYSLQTPGLVHVLYANSVLPLTSGCREGC